MKNIPFLLLGVLLIALSGTLIQAQEPTADEQAVWRLEEDYWRLVKDHDIDGYLALWDERFIGWPSSSAVPLGKANITDWVELLRANPARVFDYELRREAVRSFGDIVVTHLLVSYMFRDAKTGSLLENRPLRITHTWRRSGDTWRIITGMSSFPPTPK